MTTIAANFSFKLTGVTGTPINFNTRQNVKKRIAKIVYLASPPTDAAKLAYVGSQEITPAINLFIGDRSDSLSANSQTSTTQEFVSTSNTKNITIVNANFLVTQQFVKAESGYIPLYYKHNLPSTIIPESVAVFDSNYNKVGFDKWKLVAEYIYDEDTAYSTGVIERYNLFNSLANTFDSVNNTYTVYFVQYTDVVSSVETTYTKIINNEKAYLPATADDFWYLTPGELKPWCYAYYLNGYNVQLPLVGQLGVKYVESQRISIKHPTDYTDTQPWFPRVVNGKFRSVYAGYASTYEVPEFENQSFNPIEPYKFVTDQVCEKIDKRLLKVPHEELQTGTMFREVSIVVKKDNVAEYAVTTDSTLDGVEYRDFAGSTVIDSSGNKLYWSTSNLLGFDRISGIANVGFDLLDYYQIFATYPYKENHYLLSGLTMNPIFNSDIHKQTTVVYIVPKNTANNNTSTQVASVMSLKVARSGKIVTASQDGDSGNLNISQTVVKGDAGAYSITGVINLHYSWNATTTSLATSIVLGGAFNVASTNDFPRSGWLRVQDQSDEYRYFKYIDKTDTSFDISDTATDAPTGVVLIDSGTTVELVNFVNELSTDSTRIAADEIAAFGGAAGLLPSVFAQYFVLAILAVNPLYGKDGLSIIDVRESGGGIDPAKYDAAKLENPEVQWTDSSKSFNGQVYPSNSVIVVKLPYTLLEDFSLDNIRQIVSEKVAYGVYPLIRFYGYEPRVISMTPGTSSGETIVKWEKEGPEFVYTIWTAPSVNGPWSIANDYLLIDGNGAYNSFTVTGVASAISYIKITMEDRYYAWWYSYDDYDSIGGGLGLDEDTPVGPFGNVANFTFQIVPIV